MGSSTAARIDAIIVTHRHPDHMVELHGLFRARWFGHRQGPAIALYAPEGVLTRVAALEEGDTSASRATSPVPSETSTGAVASATVRQQPAGERSQGDTTASSAAAAQARLLGYEVQPGRGQSERVVFHFADAPGESDIPRHEIEYVEGYPREPGSGKPVEPIVAEVDYLGGFEAVQEILIGVASSVSGLRNVLR